MSSFTVCAPGTVFTGPSFTELTVIATASESVRRWRRSSDRQRVGAVEVGVALVAERGQRGVDLRLRARQRQGRRAVGARADRRAARQAHGQRAVRDRQPRGGQVAVDVVDRDRCRRWQQRRVLVDRLRARHRVHRRGVHRADGDRDRCRRRRRCWRRSRTVSVSVPTALLPGVPENVSVAASKWSQPGSAAPVESVAPSTSASPSTSLTEFAGSENVNCVPFVHGLSDNRCSQPRRVVHRVTVIAPRRNRWRRWRRSTAPSACRAVEVGVP